MGEWINIELEARWDWVTLKEGASSVCATGGTPCSETGAAGASDIFIGLEVEVGIRWNGR